MPMHSVYFDSKVSDEVRRQRLYDGQIFLFSPCASTLALIEHAREMIEAAFGNVDPRKAQFHMPVEKYVEICAPLKPAFIHHPKTKLLVKAILEELNCDMDTTYLDVPRLRMVTSDGYLTSGVGYAHHPHRDTWYSAPMSQLNWWMPIYDIETEMSMAFHPQYWDQAIKNGSSEFNYYEWNGTGRKNAAQHIKTDTRKQPKPEEPLELEPQIRFVPPAGGVIVFAAAQLHSTVPNTAGLARYSIDFRTTNIEDVKANRGAKNIDSYCTGTSLRDFMRCRDLERVSDEIASAFDGGRQVQDATLVFQPNSVGAKG